MTPARLDILRRRAEAGTQTPIGPGELLWLIRRGDEALEALADATELRGGVVRSDHYNNARAVIERYRNDC